MRRILKSKSTSDFCFDLVSVVFCMFEIEIVLINFNYHKKKKHFIFFKVNLKLEVHQTTFDSFQFWLI